MQTKINAPLRVRQGAENTKQYHLNSIDTLVKVTSRLKGVIKRINGRLAWPTNGVKKISGVGV